MTEETHDLGPNCLVHRLKNVSMNSPLRFAAQPLLLFTSRAKQARIRDDNKLNEENPTPEQTDVQPSTYVSAVSMINSHNQPVRIENFLRDLDLGTPELLKGTFKLHTTNQGKLVASDKRQVRGG